MRVGFVDYNLANFHTEKFLELFQGELKPAGVEIVAGYGMLEEASAAWAEKKGIHWAESPEILADQVDAVMLLAPDNAEVHPALAERVFPTGKPVFVDKTFAASYSDALRMAELAEKHGTPLFSSSALRFAPSLVAFLQTEAARDVLDVETRGPGQWPTYGIHAVEPAVTVLGPQIKRMRAGGQKGLVRVELEWEDGRTGHITVNTYGAQFQVTATTPKGLHVIDTNDPRFYVGLAQHIAAFFKTGTSPVPLSETLVVIRILSGLDPSLEAGTWIELT